MADIDKQTSIAPDYPRFSELPSEQLDAMLTRFERSDHPMTIGMIDLQRSIDYRQYYTYPRYQVLLEGKLDGGELNPNSPEPQPLLSPHGLARIYDHFGLKGEQSGKEWFQLHGHIAAATAAAVNIANRMHEDGVDLDARIVVTASLIHEATKGSEIIEQGNIEGTFFTTQDIIDVIVSIMDEEGNTPELIDKVITATMNTGRLDRIFASDDERRKSIEEKGIEATIVGLANARTVRMEFLSLEDAQKYYLYQKIDYESQEYFKSQWMSYYKDVTDYLTKLAPHVELDLINTESIYNETIKPVARHEVIFDPRYRVRSFTKGKDPTRNEDKTYIGQGCIAIFDGTTDTSGMKFEIDGTNGFYRTGGEIAAKIAANIVDKTNKTGKALVDEITETINLYYMGYNPNALTDSSYRFSTTVLVAKIVGDKLIVTMVGDSWFRINGTKLFKNDKEIDKIRSNERKLAVEQMVTAGVPVEKAAILGTESIMPAIKMQHLLNNNENDPLGFGWLDGGNVPEHFIPAGPSDEEQKYRYFAFPLSDVRCIELSSDGYPIPPENKTQISDFEEIQKKYEEEDPFHYITHPGTKPGMDDRAALIARRLD